MATRTWVQREVSYLSWPLGTLALMSPRLCAPHLLPRRSSPLSAYGHWALTSSPFLSEHLLGSPCQHLAPSADVPRLSPTLCLPQDLTQDWLPHSPSGEKASPEPQHLI